MADAGDVRRLALALPQVEEIDSDGFDFRVGGKGFVWSYPERRPGQPRVIRADIAVLYVGDEAEKQALLLGEPDGLAEPEGNAQAGGANPANLVGGFSSNHPGGANILTCDGSVKFLKNSVNIATVWALGSKAQGEVIDASSY